MRMRQNSGVMQDPSVESDGYTVWRDADVG